LGEFQTTQKIGTQKGLKTQTEKQQKSIIPTNPIPLCKSTTNPDIAQSIGISIR
jgi:hypothetical protein